MLPRRTPRELTVAPRPVHGVASSTRVLALGPFRPPCDGAGDEATADDAFAEAVHAYKRGDDTHAAAFRRRLARLVAETGSGYDRAVVVPGHDGGRAAHLKGLAGAVPPAYRPALVREPEVAPTKRIAADADRWANVAGTTAVTDDVTGEAVLVVDDVLASGASLATAAAALRRAGATRVEGAVLGVRVPSPHELTALEAGPDRGHTT